MAKSCLVITVKLLFLIVSVDPKAKIGNAMPTTTVTKATTRAPAMEAVTTNPKNPKTVKPET